MQFTIHESDYEFLYIKWVDINYNREVCIRFIKEYEAVKKTKNKKLISLFERLIEHIGVDLIKKLLEGDYETCRRAYIEKISRDCSMDLLLYGQYSKDNFKIISHLPIEDYKLILKRSKELVEKFSETKIELETSESKIPGM